MTMSRASRARATCTCVAADLRQAARRLAWAWGQERRQRVREWPVTWRSAWPACTTERQELRGPDPPDRSADLDQAVRQLRAVEQGHRRPAPAPAACRFHSWGSGPSSTSGCQLPGSASRRTSNWETWGLGTAQGSASSDKSSARLYGAKQACSTADHMPTSDKPPGTGWHGRPTSPSRPEQAASLPRPSTPTSVLVWSSSAGPSSTNRRFNAGRAIGGVLQREQARHLRTWRVPDTGRGIEM